MEAMTHRTLGRALCDHPALTPAAMVFTYGETEAQRSVGTEQRPRRCGSLLKITQPGGSQVCCPSTISAKP